MAGVFVRNKNERSANRIEVGIDYQIHIDLNIDLTHYDIQLEICKHAQMETA